MRNLTVLSTACGAMFMPGFFRCLKENGEREIRIVGVDSSPLDYMHNLIDGFYQVPAINNPNYLKRILDICEAENVDIVFPHISMELEMFAASRAEFEKRGIKLALTNPATLHIANNKLTLYDAMKSYGLTTPKYYKVSSVGDYEKSMIHLGYPDKDVCIKIADGSGSRGVRIVSSHFSSTEIFLKQKPSSLFISYEDMKHIIAHLPKEKEMIAMECLSMPEYTVDLLADNGKVVYVGGRLNVESSMSIAQVSEIKIVPEAVELCTKIVKILSLNGNIGFDFMFDSNGKPTLTDLNPRVTATIILFKEAGINFPYLRVKQLLGEELPVCKLEKEVKLIRKYNDIIVKR